MIAPINPLDHSAFFVKIGAKEGKEEACICNNQKQSRNQKSAFTLLMLTLLVMTCGAQQDLPDTLPEFYDSLFMFLASTAR